MAVPRLNDSTLISIKVVAGSSKTCFAGWLAETMELRVTAKAEKGKANQAVIDLLAKLLSIPKDRISISSGSSSSRKIIRIHGLSESEIRERISESTV